MKGADALAFITEWNQFKRLNLQKMKDLLAELVFFDLCNVYVPEKVEKHGIDYIGAGIPREEVPWL